MARTLLTTLQSEKCNHIKGGIYHKMQVDFAFTSNRIEGSKLEYSQINSIFETHTIEGTARVNDIFEAANHFKCFDFVLDTVNEPVTEDYIKGTSKNHSTSDAPLDFSSDCTKISQAYWRMSRNFGAK